MRLLVVADLHYSLHQWDWVVRNAGRFDAVVVAGDLLDIASPVDRDVQVIVILKYLARIARLTPRLLITSGNHDLDEPDSGGQRTAEWLRLARSSGAMVDGDALTEGGCLVSLCPWWETDSARAAIEDQLSRDAAKPHDFWIWIYHAPPSGARTSWTGHRDAGDRELTGWIRKYQPDLVFSGHIHQAPFQDGGAWVDRMDKTRVFNAGAYLAPEPPFLVVDLARRRVEWVSAAGREEIDLGPAPTQG
ncbi:MAG: metallophosphoesterase [Limisphaerales bacterium]